MKTLETSPRKQKPPLPERKYKQEQFRLEPFKVEPLETISENNRMDNNILSQQLTTPPPAYQCSNTQSTLPSAPQLQQHSSPFNIGLKSFEKPQQSQKPSTPYEIPLPTGTSKQQQLIPTVKLFEMQNPPPLTSNN